MRHMADINTTGSFDSKLSGSYTYKYDKNKHDHYLYLAFEALCFTCGCFTWSDIGIIKLSEL